MPTKGFFNRKIRLFMRRSSTRPVFVHLCLALGLGAMALVWLAGGPVALAAPAVTTWYVDGSTGSDGNDCLSPGTACATVGGAVGKASDGDTIEIAAGTYNEHDIEIYRDLTVNGSGMETTILDAGAAGRVFRVASTAVISGLRAQNGRTTDGDLFTEGGGAVLIAGSSHLTLRDAELVGNHAVGSGGAVLNAGTLVLENTQVLSNTAEGLGGGLYNYNQGVITITESIVAFNTAVSIYGGGVYAGGMALSVQDSTVAGNSAGSFGGGITVIMSGRTVLDGVTIAGNEAASGAGLFSQSGTITVTNSTVSGNNATNNYGGIYVSGPGTSILLHNSTIADNTRTNTSGVGANAVANGNNAAATLLNTILAQNQGNNCFSSSPPTSLGHNLSDDFTCGLTQTGDQPGTVPLLGPQADNGGSVPTHALLPGSPAIDAGDVGQCPPADARGVARPYDGDGDSVAVCDIGAVEARHQISIADSTVTEGNSGTVSAVFTVTLAPTSSVTVEVDYATVDDTADSGVDYAAVSDKLTFNPGETEKTILVPVIGDTDDEPDETFGLQLSLPVNADLVDGEAVGTIVDDDGLPALSIADQERLEGNTGTSAMQFEVTLSPASASVVTVEYATADGTASAGSDYTAAADKLTFQPDETSKVVSIDVLGDDVDEGSGEDFTVQLTAAANATLADDAATGTIIDDDAARLSHGSGPRVLEGDSGFTPAEFAVTLSTPAAFAVTVDFEVSSGYGDSGAKAGEDFVAISDTLTFPPGETEQTYSVQIIGDTEAESDEVYGSLIKNANVPINVNGSLAWILNDDAFRVYLPVVRR